MSIAWFYRSCFTFFRLKRPEAKGRTERQLKIAVFFRFLLFSRCIAALRNKKKAKTGVKISFCRQSEIGEIGSRVKIKKSRRSRMFL
jgi:hypothetical protein